MLGRLGQVIYWSSCGLGLLALLLAGALLIFGVDGGARLMGAFFAVCAVLIWLFGRAALYVLAAR